MNTKSLNFKLIIGIVYLAIILIGLYFLFSFVSIKDLMSYEFIRLNKDIILKYKEENLLLLSIIFFIFSIIWVLLLGFAMPLLLFAGFIFGKWWGILIVLTSTTMGATCLYILAGLFFKEIIEEKLAPKFSKFRNAFNKNDMMYFMFFRFCGGGGMPYALQNILPVLFNMSVKKYLLATFVGSVPSMFVTVAFGSGIESVIDNNENISLLSVIYSPDIYLPIIGFGIIMIIAFIIKRIFIKT